MKKTLSIVLALVTIMSCLSVAASAERVLYTITSDCENGKLVCNVTEAAEGDTIVIEAIPDDGYYLVEGSIKYGYGDGYPVKKDGSGIYSFEMPHQNVVLHAEFKKIPSTLETLWNDGIKKAAPDIWSAIKSAFPLIGAFFKNLISEIKVVISLVKK